MRRSPDNPQPDPLIAAARRAAAELGPADAPDDQPAEDAEAGPLLIQGYALGDEISRGGQGVVRAALQESTGRKVAIKLLRRGPRAGSGVQARFERGAAGEITATGQFVGSLPWASPEQTRQDPDTLDLRSDVYSLGVVLYTLLTGRFPYEVTGNLTDVLRNIASAQAAPPSTYAPGLHPDVDAILLTALRKEPGARYQSAGALARDLSSHLAGEPVQARGKERGYLLRKVLRRHRTAALVAIGYVVFATLAAAGLLALWGTARREGEAARRSAQAAQRASTAAEHERMRLERSDYFHGMNVAQVALERGNGGLARALLEQAPPALRGFEWAQLNWRLDRAKAVLDTGGSSAVDLAYAPSGRLLAVAEGSGDRLAGLADSIEVRCFAPAPAGRWWLGLATGSARLVDLDGTLHGELPGRGQPLTSLALRPQGDALLAGDADGALVEWDLAEAGVRHHYPGHAGKVSVLAWTLDGERFASGGIDGDLRVWQRGQTRPLQQRAGHGAWIYDLAWSAGDGQLISSGADHSAKVWDGDSGALLTTLRGHGDRVFAAAADPQGGGWATGSRDGTVRLWRRQVECDMRRLAGHRYQVWSMSFHPTEATLASASSDGSLCLWNVRDARMAAEVRAAALPQTAVAWSAGGGVLARGNAAGGIALEDARSGELLRNLRGHSGRITGLAFLRGDRRLVSSSLDGSVRSWDAASGELLVQIEPLARVPFALAPNPTGERLAVGLNGGRGVVLETGTGQVLAEWRAGEGIQWSVAWSPDGGSLASAGSDGLVRTFDGQTYAPRHVLAGHRDGVRCVAYSPDGARLASGGWDASVRLWDTQSGAQAQTWIAHRGRVEALAFQPDGTRLASSSVDGEVFIWETNRR